jgi:hypothetical protein
MNTTLTNIPNLPAAIIALLAAMNANNATVNHTPYVGYEVTEARRKYFMLNSVLTNGQRSGVFLIDRNSLTVFASKAYGKAGRVVSSVEALTTHYKN